jgi:large subunit ribosomal protein L5
MGVGEASQDKSILDEAETVLARIAGQKPVRRYARKAIAGFKIREGYPVGCKVTLRGKRMYEFVDRLISVALPGVKDFRGISARMDGKGNYTLGRPDHTIFPEVDLDKVNRTFGMDISVVTTARNDRECFALLKALGFPFKKS